MSAERPTGDDAADAPRPSPCCAPPPTRWSALSWPARVLALPIYFYRLVLSPLLPRSCRFEPSCSTYALQALARHGPIRGGLLTLRRLSRCHPFESLGAGSGYDPVPPRREDRAGGESGAQPRKEGSDAR